MFFVFALLVFTKTDITECKALPETKFSYSSNNILDMSYTLSEETIYWQGGGYNFTLSTKYYPTKESGFRAGHFEAGEHGGTHLDSPQHVNNASKFDMASLTYNQLSGPAVRINVESKVKKNLDYQVTKDDITAFETKHGQIPEGAFVFLYSGWGKRWPDINKVYNTQDISDSASYHYPAFAPKTAEFLVQQRNIRGIGTDAPSTDNGYDQETMATHHALAKMDRLGIENVANVDKLPDTGAFIILAPMKSATGTGAPVRVIAILPEGKKASKH